MKKIREYEVEGIGVMERYLLTLDEIIEGLPKKKQEEEGDKWRTACQRWCKKVDLSKDKSMYRIILNKVKDQPLFRIEFECKNETVIASDLVQDEIVPYTIAKAFRQCIDQLDTCVEFLYNELKYVEKQKEEAKQAEEMLEALFGPIEKKKKH